MEPNSRVISSKIFTRARHRQTTLDSYILRMRQRACANAIVQMLIVDLRPISFYTAESFQELMRVLNPEVAQGVSLQMILCKLQFKFEALKRDLKFRVGSLVNQGFIPSCSVDFWTSDRNERNVTLTFHFVDSSWKYQKFVLGVKQVEDCLDMNRAVDDTFKTYGITAVAALVTDDFSRIYSAAECEMVRCELPCFATTLRRALNNSIKVSKDLRDTVAVFDTMFHYFWNSSPARKLLKKLVRDAGLARKIKFHFYGPLNKISMLQEALELRNYLTTAMEDRKSQSNFRMDQIAVPTSGHWRLAELLVNVFQPLVDSIERSVTGSSVYPALHSLLGSLTSADDPAIKIFAKSFTDSIKSRYFAAGYPATPFLVASLLDPRFVTLSFLTSGDKQKLFQYAAELFTGLAINMETSVTFADELEQYLSTTEFLSDLSTDPLDWWKENAVRFPRIAQLARVVLAIPATSRPAERVFTRLAVQVADQRAQLESNYAEMLIMLYESNEEAANNRMYDDSDESDYDSDTDDE